MDNWKYLLHFCIIFEYIHLLIVLLYKLRTIWLIWICFNTTVNFHCTEHFLWYSIFIYCFLCFKMCFLCFKTWYYSCSKVEDFGIPKAWHADVLFSLLIETDEDHLTRLATSFMLNSLSLGHGLELIRIQC